MRKQGPEPKATYWRCEKSEIREGSYNPTYGMRRGPQNVALSTWLLVAAIRADNEIKSLFSSAHNAAKTSARELMTS